MVFSLDTPVFTQCWEPCQAKPHNLTFINITRTKFSFNDTKKQLENNFTSTLHILQVLHRWVGGAHQAMADSKTKTETLNPHTPVPRLLSVCEENVFGFIGSSASRKSHFSTLSTKTFQLTWSWFSQGVTLAPVVWYNFREISESWAY